MPLLRDSNAIYAGSTQVEKVYAGSEILYARSRVQAESGAISISGKDASLYESVAISLMADPGAVTVSGTDATLTPTTEPYATVTALATAHFKLDDTAADTVCTNEAGTNGVYTNMLASDGTTTGLGTDTGTAMQFDGITEYMLGPAISLGEVDQTLSCLFKTTDNEGYLVSTRNSSSVGGISIYISPSNVLWMIVGGMPATPHGTTVVNDGQVHHVALRYTQSSDTIDLYLDGAIELTETAPTGTITAGEKILMGCRGNPLPATTLHLNCVLDEVMFFDVALSEAQITTLFSAVDPSPPPAGYFVAPAGGSTNPADGDINNPWTLEYAFGGAGGSIVAGDTVWLRGGTYSPSGYLHSEIIGTSESPITVKPYTGETVKIDLGDGNDISWGGSYVHWMDLEIFSSSPNGGDRNHEVSGTEPAGLNRNENRAGHTDGLNVGCKMIHCIIHDLAGSGWHSHGWTTGGELYGCIIYNNGWFDTPAGKGQEHGIYMQNPNGTIKHITGCAVFNNFAYGLQIYGTSATIEDITLTGNTVFNTAAACGANFATSGTLARPDLYFVQATDVSKIGDIVFTRNNTYSAAGTNDIDTLVDGGGAGPAGTLTFVDNYFGRRVLFNKPWTEGTLSGNTVTDSISGSYDPSTGFTEIASPTSGDVHIHVEPIDDYEDGRGLITIHNWGSLGTSHSVDLTGITTLESGDSYTVHHVYDLEGTPVASGTYGGSSINLTVTSQASPTPTGYDSSGQGGLFTQDAEFGCYLIRKTSS